MKAKRNFLDLIIIGALAAMLFSCSTQKRLQRAIEKNGIKESISFTVLKYPEYFRRDSIILHDTITRTDSVLIPEMSFSAPLRDSLEFMIHESDSLRIVIDTRSNTASVRIESRFVYVHDTIPIAIPCPPIDCPDTESLSDNIKSKTTFPGWGWLLIAFCVGACFKWITAKLFSVGFPR